MTWAVFHSDGTVLVSNEIWNNLARTGASSSAHFLSTVEDIPSGPLALDISRVRSYFRTTFGRNLREERVALVFACSFGGVLVPSSSWELTANIVEQLHLLVCLVVDMTIVSERGDSRCFFTASHCFHKFPPLFFYLIS